MAAQGLVSVPTPHPTESFERKALPPRHRPIRYPKETHDPKVLPHTCKVQYASPKSQKVSGEPPDVEAEVEAEVKHHRSQAQTDVEHQRPVTPSTPEHQPRHDDHEGSDFHGGPDSLDDDSSSDYINNTSDDEEDYDDGDCSVCDRLGLLIRFQESTILTDSFPNLNKIFLCDIAPL